MTHFDFDTFAYVESRLTPEVMAEVDAHLAGCEACRAEVAALRETVAAVSAAAREVNRLPVHTARGWQAVSRRLGEPIAVRVQRASRRMSMQAAVSAAIVAMAFLSGLSLNMAHAAGPSVPFIQTPGSATSITSDTPTLAATNAAVPETPTLTLTPILEITN